jgi:hypothetical protein
VSTTALCSVRYVVSGCTRTRIRIQDNARMTRSHQSSLPQGAYCVLVLGACLSRPTLHIPKLPSDPLCEFGHTQSRRRFNCHVIYNDIITCSHPDPESPRIPHGLRTGL